MLDVEGYEKNVILGAHQTLLDHSPVIIAEAGLSDISSSVSTYGYVLAGNSGPDRVYVKA
jgi:hypothetical protein